MADTNLYASDGVWDFRFFLCKDSEDERCPPDTWILEFHDPKTFTQTIALYLNFESREHAIWWFQLRMQVKLPEERSSHFDGTVHSSWAGPVMALLWAMSAHDLPESTPWFYGNRFGPRPAIIEVTESGGYTLYDPATGRVPEPDPDELEALGAFDDEDIELDPNRARYATAIGDKLRAWIKDLIDRTDGRFIEPERAAAIDYAKAYLRNEFTLNANGIAAMAHPLAKMLEEGARPEDSAPTPEPGVTTSALSSWQANEMWGFRLAPCDHLGHDNSKSSTWALEFKHPQTSEWTIPFCFSFIDVEHATTWIKRSLRVPQDLERMGDFRGKLPEQTAQPLVTLLWKICEGQLSGFTPWNEGGPGDALPEPFIVTEAGDLAILAFDNMDRKQVDPLAMFFDQWDDDDRDYLPAGTLLQPTHHIALVPVALVKLIDDMLDRIYAMYSRDIEAPGLTWIERFRRGEVVLREAAISRSLNELLRMLT